MDDTKKEKKDNKKVARSKKNAAKKNVNGESVEQNVSRKNKETARSSLINEGKCCRCVFRNKEHRCTYTKGDETGTYVARKFGCSSFKYSN